MAGMVEKYGKTVEKYKSKAQKGKHEKGEGKPGEMKEKAKGKFVPFKKGKKK